MVCAAVEVVVFVAGVCCAVATGMGKLLLIKRPSSILERLVRFARFRFRYSGIVRSMKQASAKSGNGRNEAHEPDFVSNHLCDRVRQLRKKKGWTLEELSAACGVSRSMLSQIERNQANPTLAVAYRIAQAFGMSLGSLVDLPNATPTIDVIRVDDRTYHYRSEKDCRIRTLSPLHLEKDVEFYEVVLRPGGVLRSSAHFGGTREFLTVGQGTVRVRSNNDEAELNRGDSAHYPADVTHSIENIGRADAVLFLVDIYRGA
jgi:transcriptional regulator with XRE-family HTH domain